MPIDIDRFEDGDDLGEPPTSKRILRFLLANDDHAYTRKEIAEAIDANPETVGTNLTRLKARNLVRHREPYWALTNDRERVINALDASEGDALPSATAGADGPHREAASAFFERVRDRLDDAVEALYLFGSVALDSETTNSDVDVLAVIADDTDYAAVDDQLLDLAYDVQLEYGVPVEVHIIRASEFTDRRDRGEPFVRTVVEEGELSG